MFERYTERARRVLFFARYEAEPAREHFHRNRAPAAGTDPRGQGSHQPHLRPIAPVPREHPQGNRGADGVPREGLDLGRDPLQRGNQARPAVCRRRSGSTAAQLHRHRAPAARHPPRGALGRGDDPDGKGDAPQHRPRGHRRAAQRKDDADEGEGNAAARRVQPRPHRSGDEESARSAGRPSHRDRARPAGALPPHEEQRRAHRRTGRRQDRDRRRAGAEDRLRRRAAFPRRQAAAGARHLAHRRRDQIPRPVRRAPQGDHEGADREPEHHRVHRRAPHARRRGFGRRVARRGQHPEAGALARRNPLHRRDDARPSTASTSRRTGRSSAASRRSRSIRRARRKRSKCSWGSRIGTRRSITSSTRPKRSRRRSTSRTATSPIASCPTRRSTSSTRRAPARSCARRATARSSARSTAASASRSSRWKRPSRRRTSRRRSSIASRKCRRARTCSSSARSSTSSRAPGAWSSARARSTRWSPSGPACR